MKKIVSSSILVLSGAIFGIFGVESFARPRVAAADATMPAASMSSMKMNALSAGDSDMMAAMNKMNASMGATKLTGDQDHDFMVLMIPHHQSAIAMARVELARGKKAELRALAKDVVTSQGTETSTMKAWLAKWYSR